MITRSGYISFLIITILSVSVRAQVISSDQDLRNEVNKYGQADVSIAYPGKSTVDLITRNVSITSIREGKVYISLSRKSVEWFIARRFIYTIIPRVTLKGVRSATGLKEAMAWQTYPTYTQYDSIMRGFAASYPSICRLDTIGTSIDGRLIMAVKISDNVNLEEREPQVFYSSSIHGDELGGFILMMRLADYILQNYSTDSRVADLVNNLEIWINPLANPDGTYTSGNTVDNAIRFNADGVDLNRNFPDPLQSYNPEKETIDMVSFMKKHRFVISANFHAGSEVVNYPWDRWPRYHADDTWFNYISRAYADTVHTYAPAGYLTDLLDGVTNGYEWYQVIGGRQDYMTYERQGREVTIELDYNKMTFPSQLENLWQYNWRSLLGYLENAMHGIHGTVKDIYTGNPVSAEVYILGHDKDSSQVYSDPVTGDFVRMLFPNTYNIRFYASGYKDTLASGVVVSGSQPVNLTVYMRPASLPVDTTGLSKPIIWPNPSDSYIKCVLPEKLYGDIKVTIVDLGGRIALESAEHYNAGDQLQIYTGGLPAGSYFVIFWNLSSGYHLTSRIVVTGRFNR